MTTDRHLTVMALMNDIEDPVKTYHRCLRRAAATLTDSPEYEAAVKRGNTALLDIERAVRQWVAKHPENPHHTTPDNPTVAYRARNSGSLYCRNCGYTHGTLAPLTSDDLPDGGICDACGVDVLIGPNPTTA
jgi:hypothetical protein